MKSALFLLEIESEDFDFFSLYGSNLHQAQISYIVKELKDLFYNYDPFNSEMAYNKDISKLQVDFFQKLILQVTELRFFLRDYIGKIESMTQLKNVMGQKNNNNGVGKQLDIDDFSYLLGQQNVKKEPFNFKNFSKGELHNILSTCLSNSDKNYLNKVVAERLVYILNKFELTIFENWTISCLQKNDLIYDLISSLKLQCNLKQLQDEVEIKYRLNTVESCSDIGRLVVWYTEFLTNINFCEKQLENLTKNHFLDFELNDCLIIYPIEYRFTAIFIAIITSDTFIKQIEGGEQGLIKIFSSFLSLKNLKYISTVNPLVVNSSLFQNLMQFFEQLKDETDRKISFDYEIKRAEQILEYFIRTFNFEPIFDTEEKNQNISQQTYQVEQIKPMNDLELYKDLTGPQNDQNKPKEYANSIPKIDKNENLSNKNQGLSNSLASALSSFPGKPKPTQQQFGYIDKQENTNQIEEDKQIGLKTSLFSALSSFPGKKQNDTIQAKLEEPKEKLISAKIDNGDNVELKSSIFSALSSFPGKKK